ncbi:MAG: TetR/AcrR family transcriptional regulator [Deltaproteobacteria bacterium]|nr:TetR/AcrR family transcriptional regulator [Deltaproteobacteria bacterium]
MATKRLPTEQRRAQLAELALRLLAEGGPQGLTLAGLGKEAGIADASVLRHFKDKQAIVDAAIALFGQLLDEDLPKDIDDPMRRLGAFFVRRLSKVRERPELMALAYNARLRDAAAEKGVAKLNTHIARSARFILECVQDAQAEGMLKSTVPPQMWVWSIAGLLRGAAQAVPTGISGETNIEAMSPERAWEIVEHIMCSA